MEESSKEKEKREKATPNNIYNFTLSPYFVRKEIGIPISSPDAKAFLQLFILLCVWSGNYSTGNL